MVFPSMTTNVRSAGAKSADLRGPFDTSDAMYVTSPAKRYPPFDSSHGNWIGNLPCYPTKASSLPNETRVMDAVSRPDAGKVELTACHNQRLSPSEDTETTAYYTAMSLDDQVRSSFERYRTPDHPDAIGRRNLHPYHGPLSDIAENPCVADPHSRDGTMLLRNLHPQSLEDECDAGDGNW